MWFLFSLSSKQWKEKKWSRSIEVLFDHISIWLEKQRLTWSWIWQKTQKTTWKQISSRRKTREDMDLWQNKQRPQRWMHLMLFCLTIYQKKMDLRSLRSLSLEEKSATRKSYPQLREHSRHIKVCILVAETSSIFCTGKSAKQAKEGDPSPLLSTPEATSVVLYLALGYPYWLPLLV